MIFETDLASMRTDLLEVIRLFDPVLTDPQTVTHTCAVRGNEVTNRVEIAGKIYERSDPLAEGAAELSVKRCVKRFAKLALYEALKIWYGREMPWGALTGIRPARLYYQLREENGETDQREFFRSIFHVSEEKTRLLYDVVHCQEPHLNTDRRAVDLYIGIPFCTSRCAYCSFLSAEIAGVVKWVQPYVSCLLKEIDAFKSLCRESGLTVRALYIGGGTPTALPDEEFQRVLAACDFNALEFTCEAGRPDTITKTKLELMQKYGVNRISINPQTFHDRTLEIIGRRHTTADTVRGMKLAGEFPFAVNMDLIAGLPGESFPDFRESLLRAEEFSPANITVHTLALKSGAKLKLDGYSGGEDVPEMLSDSYRELKKCGYEPYYLYRQKYMASNLENVGYAKEGSVCLYNIDIMEENIDILAFGANAISKRVFPEENRIERQANNKDIATYLQNIDKLIDRKRSLFF